MNKILNIHCHPSENTVLKTNCIYCYLHPHYPIQTSHYSSFGVHPWYIPEEKIDWVKFRSIASQPCVKMIGECGLDTFSKVPLPTQINVFKAQVEISESLQKPLLIHMVRTTTEIMAIHDQLKPTQPWIIHGFRGKPQLAKQYLDHHILLSFGYQFNLKTIKSVPLNKLFLETSDSQNTIDQVIEKVAYHKKIAPQELIKQIYSNTASLFFS